MADKSPSRDTRSTPNPPTLSYYTRSERNTDGQETNPDVSALLLSSLTRWYIIQVCFCHVKLRLAGSIFLHPKHQNSRYEQKKIWIQVVENDPTIFDNLAFQKNIRSPIWRFNYGWRHAVVQQMCRSYEFQIVHHITSMKHEKLWCKNVAFDITHCFLRAAKLSGVYKNDIFIDIFVKHVPLLWD